MALGLAVLLLSGCDQLFKLDRLPTGETATDGGSDGAVDSPSDHAVLMTCVDDTFAVWPEPQRWAPYVDLQPITSGPSGLTITLTPNTTTTNHYSGIDSAFMYTLTDGSFAAQIVTVPTGANSEAELIVSLTGGLTYEISVGAQGAQFVEQLAGGTMRGPPSTFADGELVRIRHDAAGQRVYFETSSDGVSYTSRWDVAAAPALPAATVTLNAGTYDVDATPGRVTFTHAKILAATCP